MDPIEQFKQERRQAVSEMIKDEELRRKSIDWMIHADQYKYSYNFTWLGRPIIKLPADIIAFQEIIWNVKPDLIIETGIAHGGSIIFSASMLEILGKGEVVAVDIDIREHNRRVIEEHPMMKRITMIQGSSIDPVIIDQIREKTLGKERVMVFLDSLHTHDHVLAELRAYWQFVTPGSYIVLPDTFIELFPKDYFKDRPWDVGNNPMTALRAFLEENDHFKVDHEISDKLLISEGIDAYLKRTN
jgi:cephalosporin hydroxylase